MPGADHGKDQSRCITASGSDFCWPIFSGRKIVDVEKECLMIELTGNQSKLEAFLNLSGRI